MQIEHREIYELLGRSPLFIECDEEALNRLAGLFQTVVFRGGDVVFKKGDPSEVLYILYEGQIRLETENKGEEEGFALLKRGDFFGEEALLYDDPRFYQAIALTDTVLIRLDVENYLTVYEELGDIEEMLEVLVHSRKLATQVSLPWLGKDEFVHVMTRRHLALLWGKLISPAAASLVITLLAVLLQVRWLPERPYGWLLLGIGLPLMILWAVWRYFDWRNDYLLVTNKRVVRVERVALIYESRHEAPLHTVMSVGIHRSRIGSLFGYADVVVLTYVGTVRLRDLGHAELIADLIESYWHRSANQNRREEADMMAQKLGEKLDLPQDVENVTQLNSPRQEIQYDKNESKEPGFLAWLFSDFIRLRYEGDGAITYRKHWFVLVKMIAAPSFLMLLGLAGLAGFLGGVLTFAPVTPGIVSALFLIFFSFIWMVYQYADWRDDIYRITFDQIIDIDRKPLGKVRRRSAPLENVLSIEYERLGFWGYLLNFGTVYISVGGTKLSFDYVYNPSEVQQDIFYRMGERLEQLQQFEIDGERERVSEWIASYHHRIAESQRKRRAHHGDRDEI
jgi:CRP-like cAMP-binding protein